MLFFQRSLFCHMFAVIKKNRTSPVRSCKNCSRKIWNSCGKRALLPASLSLEAALVLPMFLFACFCLMMPMRIMDSHRKVQGVLEQVGQDLSQYAYAVRQLEAGNSSIKIDETVEGVLSVGYAAAQVQEKLKGERIQDISFLGSRIMEDDTILLVMNYRVPLPFSVFSLDSVPMENLCIRRAWTGRKGAGTEGEEQGEEQQTDEIVYIGKNPTRYHLSRYCHYLSNNLQEVDRSYVDDLRNSSGKRYHPCKRCAKGEVQGTVYITPSGTSYHAEAECSAIVAYVREVKKSQVEHLGVCSYCGQGGS